MISELMPPGYDNMFFALFGITNRAVSLPSPLGPRPNLKKLYKYAKAKQISHP